MIAMMEQDRQIADVIAKEQSGLRSFIRRRVANDADAEDLLQEVFFELVRAHRLLLPIDFVTGWLYRVARNRITDLFRKKRPQAFSEGALETEEGELLELEELLPARDGGPEAEYLRNLLLDELRRAVAELPAEQREVFVAHEIEGRSFKELADETGVNVNTLLSRKHYAVKYLRHRLRALYDEFSET